MKRLWPLLGWALLGWGAALTCSTRYLDADLWGHLLYGRAHMAAGSILRADPYSYTEFGRPWVNHEWLFELGLAVFWTHWGAWGLHLTKMALGLVTFACAARAACARGATFGPIALTALPSLAVLSFFFLWRPQSASFFCLAALLWILAVARERTRWLFLAPLVFALWANLHGGFIAGLGVLALAAAGSCFEGVRGRRLALHLAGILALCILATLINPYGLGLWRMLSHELGRPRDIVEWESTWTVLKVEHGPLPQSLALFVLAAGSLVTLLRRRDLLFAAVLAGTTGVAVLAWRHVGLLAIVLLALAPVAFAPALARVSRAIWRGLAVSGVLFLLAATVRMVPWVPSVRVLPAMFPVDAVHAMKVNAVRGNVLVLFDWAQYLMWHLSPECKVFFDGRFRTVYDYEIEDRYFAFLHGDDSALSEYPTDMVLVPPGYTFADQMSARKGWREVYRDADAVLFFRDGFEPPWRPVEPMREAFP